MIKIIEHPEIFEVRIDWDYFAKRNVEVVKKIPGARYNPLRKIWTTPLTSRDQTVDLIKSCKATLEKKKVLAPEFVGTIKEMPDLKVETGLKETAILRPYQSQGVAANIEFGSAMNGDDPGLGKAQPLTAKIATPKGWKLMGDIKLMDNIFGTDGKIYKVNGIYPQIGKRAVYKVTFSDGFSCECDKEHLWTVRDQNRRRRDKGWTVRPLSELIKMGIVQLPTVSRLASGRQPALKWEIPLTKPVNIKPKDYVIHPYILGALLGDGYLCGKPIAISIPDHEIETVSKIESFLPDTLKLYRNIHPACPQYLITQNTTTKANLFKTEIKRLGINVKGPVKFIPDHYKRGSVKQRTDLLKGLMDTDGSCKKNRTTFHTVSPWLAYDIAELVQSLGGIAIVRSYDRTKHNKGIEYQVNIRTDFAPFYLKAKLNQWQPNKRSFASRYIKQVEFLRNDDVQCISVTAPNKMYLTDNYIATHNTIQTIATLSALKCFPAVIACPASLKLNWAAEIKKFSNMRAMILTDKAKVNWMRYHETGLIDIFIVNYESFSKYFVKEMPPKGKLKSSAQIELVPDWAKVKAVVMDESHRLKNPGTIQTKLALRLAHTKDHVFLLTGTPVVNKPIDLYPQLAILGKLDLFGGKKGFINRYCDGGQGANNLKELNYLMHKHCYFRRQKKDVLKDLPDKVRQTITCEISTRREYDFAYNEFKSWLASTGCDDKEIARKLRGEILVKMNALRAISARGKIDAVKDHIDELVDAGQKVVVFANLHSIIDQVKALYPGAVEISGSISEAKRQENISRFQSDPSCNVIVCNIRAGGVGITLTASSNVIFIEYPWTWADCIQCEDRTHRIGQKDSVTAAYLFGQNTIDQRLFEIIQEKKDIGDAITGNTEVIEMQMIDKVLSLFND